MDLYLVIVGFLLLLAVIDLIVGVSNDAANFLNSAIGAKVAKYNTVIFVVSIGIFFGAMMSSGMMDVARHGIIQPQYFTFENVISAYLAVMVSDVILLNIFTTLGKPTSSTVSIVFDLLGGACAFAAIKFFNTSGSPEEVFLEAIRMVNTDKAMMCIMAIFLSVAIAFVFGMIVQWIVRFLVTFHYGRITSFILRTVVIVATCCLAFSFASNDLGNFIGVPLAALDAYIDFSAHGGGDADSFMMTSLMGSSTAPKYLFVIAGAIMVLALVFTKKARKIVETTIKLSRRSDDDAEKYEASELARNIVRPVSVASRRIISCIPSAIRQTVNKRFVIDELEEDQAFDYLRACVNLLLSAALVSCGTLFKVPLSTTYVMFMVGMGTSLADRAWGRESAVFRITGVISVIGGWFLTAGAAFTMAFLVTLFVHYGGPIAMAITIALTFGILIKSNMKGSKSDDDDSVECLYQKVLEEDVEATRWDTFREYFTATTSETIAYSGEQLEIVGKAFVKGNYKPLNKAMKSIIQNRHRYDRLSHRQLNMLRSMSVNNAGDKALNIIASEVVFANIYRSLEHITRLSYNHVANDFQLVNPELGNEFITLLEEAKSVCTEVSDALLLNDATNNNSIRNQIAYIQTSLHAFRLDYAEFIYSNDEPFTTANVFMGIIRETIEIMKLVEAMSSSSR